MKLFGGDTITTDEQYKELLKKKGYLYMGLSILGLIALLAIFLGKSFVKINSHAQGFYSGFGGAVLLMGIALYIKNYRVMNNPKQLRKARINNYDERNVLIVSRAFRTASSAQLIVIYITCIFGIFIDPIIVHVGLIYIYVFLGVYLVSQVYFRRKL